MYRTDRRLVLMVVSLASFLLNFDLAGIIVAMPSIQVAFGATSDQLSWAQNSFAVAGCATLPLVGVLGDRLGRARVFCAAAAVFALASVGCAVSQSINQLTWWRTGQGIGAAAFLALGTALLADSWGKDVSRTLGFITGAGAIGLSLGPVLSGALVDVLSWRTLLAIEAGAGALLMVVALVVLTGITTQHRASGDPLGAIAATIAIASTVVFVHLIQSHQSLVALLATAVIALAAAIAFLIRQRVARTPALPRAVWKAPGFRVILGLGLLAYLALSSTAFFVSLVAQSVDDWTAFAAGLIMLPVTLGLVLGTLLGPRLTRRIGVRAVVVLGYSSCVVGTLALLGLSTNTLGWSLVVVGNAVSGFGVGIASPQALAYGLSGVQGPDSGSASSWLWVSRQVGSSFGFAVLSLLTFSFSSLLIGVRMAMIASALAFVASVIVALIGIHASRTSLTPAK